MTRKLNTDKVYNDTGTEGQQVTAPTQKAGFRFPKTVLWVIKY